MAAVRDTSREAYHTLRDEGTQKERILRALERGPASDKVLEKRTGLRISSVTARRNALVDDGKVEEAYQDVDGETGKPCTVWRLVR